MEVHPPEHPIHTWRDFFIHIATIVVGLLIAIGLEQSVEWMHHRHTLHTAHRDLRNEMVANSDTVQQDRAELQHVRRNLLTDLGTLREMQARKAGANPRLTASWSWQGLSDSAFDTARDTGALALMPYEEVQSLDVVYGQQQLVADAALAYIRSLNRIRLPLQGGRALAQASPDEVSQMIASCSETLGDIDLLESLMRPLPANYKQLTSD